MFCLWMLSCQIFFILDQLKILQVICVWERKIKYMYKSEIRYMCRIIYRIQQVRIPSFTDWFVYSCVSFCHRTFIKLLFYSLKHTKKIIRHSDTLCIDLICAIIMKLKGEPLTTGVFHYTWFLVNFSRHIKIKRPFHVSNLFEI